MAINLEKHLGVFLEKGKVNHYLKGYIEKQKHALLNIFEQYLIRNAVHFAYMGNRRDNASRLNLEGAELDVSGLGSKSISVLAENWSARSASLFLSRLFEQLSFEQLDTLFNSHDDGFQIARFSDSSNNSWTNKETRVGMPFKLSLVRLCVTYPYESTYGNGPSTVSSKLTIRARVNETKRKLDEYKRLLSDYTQTRELVVSSTKSVLSQKDVEFMSIKEIEMFDFERFQDTYGIELDFIVYRKKEDPTPHVIIVC